ncbi:MAG: SDR family NAD(P)-dependent oxidoreductase [Lachnospiraceae bacterium]|nr:SDR family NAD(P)-dependent oxidoreductase [Lachnospiraceae bacterium]
MKIAVITGASSGIGKEFLIQLDKACNDLDQIWAISRTIEETKLPDTKAKIIRLPLDLSKEEAFETLSQKLKAEDPKIKVLVNSAGFGKMGKFTEIPLAMQKDMVSLNVSGLMKACHICIPYMAKGGYIINMASAAAFMPQMRFAIYAATKAFVLSFSRALHYELAPKKVSVTAVCPGPVKTNFFAVAEETGYTLQIKKFIMVKPEKVVAHALTCARARKQLAVYGLPMKALQLIGKIVPTGFALSIYDRMV